MRSKRVLVVDDIEEQREIYALLLRHHGYEVLEAGGGAEALRLAREERPDVILLDMLMSEIDGWVVAERLSEDPSTDSIPIVALTVLHSTEDQQRAEAAGAESYLTKPCAPAEMLEEVRRLIGTPDRADA